ncbi:hypothetical protein O1L60_39870 [Streptomyces diastatochromogenes]|nr:hypothetical protein [Streptomyces diastatochromogenes]
MLLLSAAAQAVLSIGEDPQGPLWRRYLALIIDGLRPQGAHPLPVPAPTLARFTG